MQTPEETVSRIMGACLHHLWEGWCVRHHSIIRPDNATCVVAQEAADLIRARDAEVRADERGRCSIVHATLPDEALVAELVRRGVLEEKRENLLRPVQVPCDCEHPTHARLVGDDSPLTHVTSEVVSVVRYASRWQPDTRTSQQRSDDAVDELRRRLKGDA